MTTYAKAVNGGEVEHCRHLAPPVPPLDWENPGDDFIEVLNWPPPPRPDPHSAMCIQDGVIFWHDPRVLADVIAESVAAVDTFADACRLAVVGDAARIKEYERAQAGAEAYRDAGFSGPVPPGVASWAHAKRRQNWTAQQAAEDILFASARWYAALDEIRALRLDAKESIRAAPTIDEVSAIAATFRATLTAAMQGVQ